MDWLIISIWSLYFMMLAGIWVVWERTAGGKVHNTGMPVSVIVPFRNEERTLEKLVQCLSCQAYHPFEVIFVDDHSTDRSVAVLEHSLEACAGFSYRIIHLDKSTGKKAAITKGVGLSGAPVILTTDADCYFGRHWIRSMVSPFGSKALQLLAGPVVLEGEGIFQRLQAMEFMALIGTGAAMIGLGRPGMANGANLAYRKEAFDEVEGFEGYTRNPSGDDEFLLMKVHKKYPDGVSFLKDRQAIVSTPVQENWKAFKNQRMRWASKWKTGKRVSTVLAALFIFVFNLSVIGLSVSAVAGLVAPETFLILFLLKLTAEFVFLLSLHRFFKRKFSFAAFFLGQALYPCYVIYFGLKANFGSFQWKGRSYPIPSLQK